MSKARGAPDSPSIIAIARHLAEQGAAVRSGIPGDVGNFENHCLEQALKALNQDPPNVAAARDFAAQGVAHAWRGDFEENRDEAWLCAAVAELLRAA